MTDSKPHQERQQAGFQAWAIADGDPHRVWHIERHEARSLFEQYQAAQRALAYVDVCFKGDDESVIRKLRTALGVAQAWEVKNEDARYVAALIRDVLPPVADASGVVRAALADSIPASEGCATCGGARYIERSWIEHGSDEPCPDCNPATPRMTPWVREKPEGCQAPVCDCDHTCAAQDPAEKPS